MLAIPVARKRNLSNKSLIFPFFWQTFNVHRCIKTKSVLNVKIPKLRKRIDHLHGLIVFKEMKGNLESCLLDPCNLRSCSENTISMNH